MGVLKHAFHGAIEVLFKATYCYKFANASGPNGYGPAYSGSLKTVHDSMQMIGLLLLPLFCAVALVMQAVRSHSLTKQQQSDQVVQHMRAAGKSDVYSRLNLKGPEHANFYKYMKLLDSRLEAGKGQGPRLCGVLITPSVSRAALGLVGTAAVSLLTLALSVRGASM